MEFKELIDNLTIEQKIAIVSDPYALSDVKLPDGFVKIKIESVDGQGDSSSYAMPTYSSLGYAWNPELAAEVFSCKTEEAKAQEVNVLSSPRAGFKASPLTGGISEDPYVNRCLLSAFEKGVANQGGLACITTGFDKADVKNMDRKISPRAVNDLYFSSFSHSKDCAFSYPHVEFTGEYAKINTQRLSTYLINQASPRKGFVFCHDCPPELAVAQLNEGNILVGANSNGVRSAVNRFNDMYAKVEHGELDSSVLEDALDNYTALSISQLDSAVERVLKLSSILASREVKTEISDKDELLLKAATESIVLLENKGILPITLRRKNICVIGGESHMEFMSGIEKAFELKGGYNLTCRVGYRNNTEQTEDVEKFAFNSAKTSDVTILLLGNREEKSYYLPATQLAVIDKLIKLKKPLIAVILGDAVVDVSFSNKVFALLMCPSIDSYSPLALTNILLGKISPSGKLINTLYDNSQEYFKNVKDYRNACGLKVGVFSGYRYYDTAYLPVKYPFGHGLSYTKFTYSKLRIVGNKIIFRVKNTGKVAGAEVAQVYIGKTGGILRPDKELKAFKKIFLKRRRSKTVKITLTREQLEIFNQGRNIVEKGKYDVYVGSSVSDLRLHGKMMVGGTEVIPNNDKLVDFVPDRTNIVTSGYTVAPLNRTIFEGRKKKKIGRKSIIFSLVLAFMLSLLTLNVLPKFAQTFIDTYVNKNIKNILSYVLTYFCPTLFVFGCLLMILGAVSRKKARRKYEIISKGNPAKEDKPVKPQAYKSLFDTLYHADEEIMIKKPEERSVISLANEEFIGTYSEDITFNKVCDSLTVFLNESGITADKNFARKILASFSASRFIVMPTNNIDDTNKLLRVLSRFFGGGLYAQSDEALNAPADLISVAHGTTAFSTALENCKKARDNINIITFNTDSITNISKVFAPFLKCSDHRNKIETFIYCDGKTNKLAVYPNLWFVVLTNGDCNYVSEKLGFTDASCILNLNIARCSEKNEKTSFTPLNFYQFQRMEQKLMNATNDLVEKYSLDEDKYWKKFDRIEEYLNKRAGYNFSNKFNMSLERYIGVFLACEGEGEYAFDLAVSSKIMLSALSLVSDNINEEGGLLEQIDIIFGDSATEETKKIIAICS